MGHRDLLSVAIGTAIYSFRHSGLETTETPSIYSRTNVDFVIAGFHHIVHAKLYSSLRNNCIGHIAQWESLSNVNVSSY